jgi:hypothetical protein
MTKLRLIFVVAVLAALAFLTLGPDAMSPLSAEPANATGASNPVVVELFTSQSCSSCPPAEAYFRELSARPDLIALEWHVDYWNDLRVANAGRWKDPYSSPAWTARQQVYNQRLTGSSSGYTPQAVIAGRTETTGFNRKAIEQEIRNQQKTAPAVRISAARAQNIRFAIEGAPKNAEALLVTYRLAATTGVKGGENHGRTLSSAHLVTSAKKLGSGPSFSVPLPANDEGCAILLSEPGQGRMLAAAACPS